MAGVTASFNHHESETALFDNFDAGINECSTDASALAVWINADHIYLAPRIFSSRSATIVWTSPLSQTVFKERIFQPA
ncbi:MAG: hypothetical protein VYC52_04295, partial [Pseudomonadota bacterium]|nr:hypothetical protein [Pseudomonadota bacterium]